jgi:drug/metabolite transporter (DMT)-like permease
VSAESDLAAPAHGASERSRHWRAVGLIVLASACFAILDTLSKLSGQFAPVAQTLWMRYFVQVVLTLAWWFFWLRPALGLSVFRTAHPRFHLARGLMLNLSTGLCFVGLRYMPLAEFTAVAFISPMLAMVLAGWLLKEAVSRAQWGFALAAFAGALMVIRPGTDLFGWAVVFPVALALVNAGFQTLTRRLAVADDHPVLGQAMVGVAGWAVFSVPLFWPDTFNLSLSLGQWAVLVGIGVAGTLGHLVLMRALGLDSPVALAPVSYVQIGFAMLAGVLFFGHVPDGWGVTGMLVIAGAGVLSGLLRKRVTEPS